ncbi:hypothetical protein [Endozoicomonas sp.]|uniref:hypothetical protein n=1 Tax=Endozoicomonas sp. TaxID=1892382 RepID=UPI003AF62F58
MMKITHKICCALLLLTTAVFTVHADSLPNHMKEASELTSNVFQGLKSNVLLCVLPSSTTPNNVGDVIGKVIPGLESGSFLCEYSQYSHGLFTGPHFTTDFHWLDVTYDQLASWLTSLAHFEKSSNGHYYVLRQKDHNPDHPPAICAQNTARKGFEFGYEVITDSGEKSCDHFVGAVYTSPFFDDVLAGWNECTGDSFSPDCHRCNGDGCSAFRCSAFTTWDQCPKGSHVCGYETCVGNLCTQKRLCEWDK